MSAGRWRLVIAVAGLALGLGCRTPSRGAEGVVGTGGLAGEAGVWTWNDVAGTACDDGTATGVGVNRAPGGTGADLLVVLMGGGACWNADNCLTHPQSVHGPFGKAQLAELAGGEGMRHAFDRGRQSNPFRGFDIVYVPYCTSDVHVGRHVAQYDAGQGPRAFRHVGRLNAEAILARVRATWPRVERLVIMGSSAGGAGATLDYDLFRRGYPDAKGALIIDAGPFLKGDDVPRDARAAWYAQWRLGDVLDPLCAACRDDMSLIYPALAARYPNDQVAFVSSAQDAVMTVVFGFASGAAYEGALRAMLAERFAPVPRFRAFLTAGDAHILLGGPDQVVVGGLTLEGWLRQMISGDPGWRSIGLGP